MRKAWCLVRAEPVYRRRAFVAGLEAAGFVVQGASSAPRGAEGDVLVIWNRYGHWHDLAVRFEAEGGAVVVAENAYAANDRADRRRYALAREAHNGAGWWPLGGPERWDALGLTPDEWTDAGEGFILVCPNRSFGMPGFVMDPRWAERTVERLKKLTRRPMRVRPHPGNDPPKVPLARDLEGAYAVVIWSSSAGVEALLRGIPVFCDAPWWICKGATQPLTEIEHPRYDSAARLEALRRLAWAQWHVEEIERGEPFQHLCNLAPAFAGCV